MKRIGLLAAVCLVIVSEAITPTRAGDRDGENQSVTIYTSRGLADRYTCSAVNISDKTLGMTFAILDNKGQALSCATPTTCTNVSLNATTTRAPSFQPPGAQ